MGQYYTPLLISSHNQIQTLNSHSFESGAKLMEHAWVGNQFVNAAYALIFGKPKRVAWIGDYADNPYDATKDAYARAMPHAEFKKFYNCAMEDNTAPVSASIFSARGLDLLNYDTKGTFLINHSRKCCFSLEEYIWRSISMDGWCVNPLPLLTACGNGRGGGDFHEQNRGYKDVGIWAFDLLEYNNTVPPGYENVKFRFMERGM